MIQTAFDLSFDQWPPVSPPPRHSVNAPIGSIRYAKKGKSTYRMIKVRMTGISQQRWMKLARFWWLKNNGAIPAGKKVGHFDGNTLNDDPGNYTLMDPADTLAIAHMNDPAWSEKQLASCHAACARMNRERSRIRRAMGQFCPTRWYGVNFETHTIINFPHKQRWLVHAHLGLQAAIDKRFCRINSSILGYPDLTIQQALFLSALADGSEKTILAIRREAHAICAYYRWPQGTCLKLYYVAATYLIQQGLIDTWQPRGKRHHLYRIKPDVNRGEVSRVVCVKGIELTEPRFKAFKRIELLTEAA